MWSRTSARSGARRVRAIAGRGPQLPCHRLSKAPALQPTAALPAALPGRRARGRGSWLLLCKLDGAVEGAQHSLLLPLGVVVPIRNVLPADDPDEESLGVVE